MEAIFSLDGKALLTRSGNVEPFLTVKSFEIKKPGVYTLEGPNGSGKSMFIRFLTGTLPGAIEQNFGASLSINGEIAKIYSYRDAVTFGIVSVFQDDDLISSMTVFDNIVLRHGTSSFRKGGHYLWDMFFNLINPPMTSIVRVLGPVLSPKVQSALERLEPKKIDWKSRQLLRERATYLLEQHGVHPRILDEMPSRLSGGGRAAAKLICAQLHDKTKILLLDEAFNGVERNIWPRFVDGIKTWADEKGAVVVAITHSSEELLRWDPLARFDIRDGLFVIDDEFLDGVRRQATSPRQLSSPVFELAATYPAKCASLYTSLWSFLGQGTEMIAIVDSANEKTPIVSSLYGYCPAGYKLTTLTLSEADLQSLDVVVGRIEALRPKRRAVIVVAGGSVLRVLTSIALQVTQHLATTAVVVAPTSFDDAVRAVLSHTVGTTISATTAASGAVTLSASFAPDAFILPLDSLDKLSSDEIKLSLVPCVRLGLLFDEELFQACKEAFSKANSVVRFPC
jgi:ABC-type multidrug transport system ATPase subunit